MEEYHSRCKKVQKTLLHGRKLRKVSFVAENGERSLTLQKSAVNFIAQQKFMKIQLWRKVTHIAEKCRNLYYTAKS